MEHADEMLYNIVYLGKDKLAELRKRFTEQQIKNVLQVFICNELSEQEAELVIKVNGIGDEAPIPLKDLYPDVNRDDKTLVYSKGVRKMRHPVRQKALLQIFGMYDEEEKVVKIKNDTDYIEDLDLSIRTYNCVCRAGIRSISALMDMSLNEIKQIKNLGKKSFSEILLKLDEYYKK